MSLLTPTELECPRCGKTFTTTVWSTVNATLHAGLRERVLDGSIRQAKCPHCQQGITYEPLLLYHDMDRSFMIYLAPSRPGKPFTAPTAVLDMAEQLMTPYRLRFVTSYNQLREKIIVFESGLNDYALEVLKLMVWANKFPEKNITDDSVYFSGLHTDGSGKPTIVLEFFEATNYLGQIQVPRSVYDRSITSAGEEKTRTHALGEWTLVNQSMFPKP